MIELFHCISARSFRPLWLLEELSLPYTLRMLAFPPRVQQRQYLTLNPLGTVPLLLDGDVRMTESSAMCQYLAAKYGEGQMDVPVHDPAFADYLNFLHFGEATLTFPQTLVLRYRYFEAEARRQPQVADDYAKWFLARLRTLEHRLSAQPYLCGERFTAADVSVAYALLLAQHLGLAEQFTPAVGAYWHRLQQRPAYLRAQDAQWAAAKAQGIAEVAAPDLRP